MPAKKKTELLQGTLDMLVLKVLTSGPLHGYAIVRKIQEGSDQRLLVEEGSLYPALHRMQRRGWIQSEWGLSESNRRAKFYELTSMGRGQLSEELERWSRFVDAVSGVVAFDNRQPATEG